MKKILLLLTVGTICGVLSCIWTFVFTAVMVVVAFILLFVVMMVCVPSCIIIGAHIKKWMIRNKNPKLFDELTQSIEEETHRLKVNVKTMGSLIAAFIKDPFLSST